MSDIKSILAERGSRYGEFKDNARVSQAIKAAMIDSPNWEYLESDFREALEMMAHKISRILNGDSSYIDSWIDISGFATLIVNELNKVDPNDK